MSAFLQIINGGKAPAPADLRCALIEKHWGDTSFAWRQYQAALITGSPDRIEAARKRLDHAFRVGDAAMRPFPKPGAA